MTAAQDITISVRRLAERVHRRGDIHARLERFVRAEEGSAVHRRLQAGRGPEYTAEVPLSLSQRHGRYLIMVRGRADGVIRADEGATVEEIKSTRCQLDTVADHNACVHDAQVWLYAAMLTAAEALPGAFVALRYVHVDDGRELLRRRWCTADELAAFAHDTLAAYAEQLEQIHQWRMLRDAAAANAGLPFGALRASQRQLAQACWQVQAKRRTLLGEAPTGTGKTLGALLPAVHGLARGQFRRVLFLTARGTGRDAAIEALSELRRSGFRLRSVVLHARADTCFNPELPCDPDRCRYAKGYYDRRARALHELLKTDHLDAVAVRDCARRHTVCPFELSLDAVLCVDVIIGDYNYVFDPSVRIQRLAELADEHHLVVDEAHQLPERVREMYSAQLSSGTLRAAIEGGGRSAGLGIHLDALGQALRRSVAGLAAGDGELQVPHGEFFRRALERFNDHCGTQLAASGELPAAVLQLYFETLSMQRVWNAADDAHVLIARRSGAELALSLRCLDAAPFAGPVVRASASAALVSATLGDPDECARLLGLGAERHARVLPSPFPPERQQVLAVTDICTLYQSRTHTADAVAHLLCTSSAVRHGNYLVFAPSFAYLDILAAALAARSDAPRMISQRSCLDSGDRQRFIDTLRAGPPSHGSRLALAVLGGVFAESVDLAGDALIGVFVVGIGLPPASLERELVRARSDDGFELAYRRPAMQKVMQAGGRLIRTESDAGVLVLIDPRFADDRWRRRLPSHWRIAHTRAADVPRTMTQFWNQVKP